MFLGNHGDNLHVNVNLAECRGRYRVDRLVYRYTGVQYNRFEGWGARAHMHWTPMVVRRTRSVARLSVLVIPAGIRLSVHVVRIYRRSISGRNNGFTNATILRQRLGLNILKYGRASRVPELRPWTSSREIY